MEDPNRSAAGGAEPLVQFDRPYPEPLLDADDIQGDIVPGFLKPHMAIAALTVRDVSAARSWIGSLAGQPTTLRQVMPSRHRIRAQRHGIRPPQFAARDLQPATQSPPRCMTCGSTCRLASRVCGHCSEATSSETPNWHSSQMQASFLGCRPARPSWVIRLAPTQAAPRLGR